jgi:enoyl-CoA hydratase/carnithine racemase
MSFSSDVFSIERDGHIATLWLDRPEKRNAMAPSFWHDLPDAMAELGDDPEVRGRVGRQRQKLLRRPKTQ